MATVIGVEGSAYRHKGAKVLIDETGKIYGMISGGCLEEDLIYQANEVFQVRKPKIATYDLKSENDLGWGQGAGCNGIITIYIEETGWNINRDKTGKSLWEKIDQKLLLGQRVACLKFLDEENYDKGIYYCEDGEVLHCSEGLDEQLVIHLESSIFCDKTADIFKMSNQEILTELYKPKELLYIFGAGLDLEPLVELASKLDFSVHLIDPRSERFHKGNFSMADQLIEEFPHIFLQNNDLPINCFVLIMTHKFEWDKNILKHFVKKPPQYLGILGPKKRTERLMYPDPIPEWIHSPVGIDIFAEGPEEISISICAEIVKRRNEKYKNQSSLYQI